MTPLNNILSNAKLLMDRFKKGQLGTSKNLQTMIEGIIFSADIMQMYNNSLIQKMKCEINVYKPNVSCIIKINQKVKIFEILKPF